MHNQRMTITAGAPPAQGPRADHALGFVTGGVIGASLTAFVSGCVVGKASLIVGGLVLPAVTGLLFLLVTQPRRAREAAAVPRTALAVIESLEAVEGVASDVPTRFELSVAPDDDPAFRVEIRQSVNRVELADYRPRGIVVVEYPPDRPWKLRIVRRPTPEWEERAAGARVDSVPGPAMRSESPAGCAGCFLTLLGLLLGVAAVLLLFRADLFDRDEGRGGALPEPSVSSSSFATSMTSETGTVSLDPGRSMLDEGELRAAVESLTQGADRHGAFTLVAQERLLTVVFAPESLSGFDPRSLPYDRLPALVEEAGNGAGSRRSWQLTAENVTGSVTIRIVVTGDRGTRTLEADEHGKVLSRSGS